LGTAARDLRVTVYVRFVPILLKKSYHWRVARTVPVIE